MRIACAVTLVLSLLAFKVQAQDSIVYSNSFRFGKNMAVVSCVQLKSDGFLMVEASDDQRPKVHVREFNAQGEILNEYHHSLIANVEDNLSLERIMPRDSVLHVFFSAFDKKNKILRAFVAVVKNNGKTIEEPKELLSTQSDFQSQLQISESPNKKGTLLYFEPGAFRREDVPIHFIIVDAEFNTIHEKELFLPYGSDVAPVQQCLVDDSSNVYLMSGKNPVKNNVRVLRSQGGRYLVFYYNFKENKLKEYDISLKEKQVVAAKGALNEFNEMIVGGYYSNDFSFAVAGTFVFNIAKNGGALKTASYMAFPKEFLSQFMGDRTLEKYPELSDFFLDHMIIQPGGTLLLIGEQYTISERVNMDPVTGRTIVENLHHFDDVIVHQIQENGKINWSGYIPKAQHTSLERDKCGYNFFIQPSGLSFFFNDHPDNFKLLQQNPQARVTSWNGSKSAVISYVLFDNQGRSHRKNLVSHKSAGGVLLPGLSNEQIHGSVILGLSQNKDYKFCILK